MWGKGQGSSRCQSPDYQVKSRPERRSETVNYLNCTLSVYDGIETQSIIIALERSSSGMLKAYDTFLQVVVFASEAARYGGLESDRYICANCGEEVILAAVSSIYMRPYFKHRNGNNNVECEEYCGQGTTRSHCSRIDKNARAEFYFDKNTKLFYLGLSLREGEISAYAEEEAWFELRAAARGPAFIRIRLDRENFFPDVPRLIPIERFSHEYLLSNTFSEVEQTCQVFKNNGDFVPTFFRIQGNDSNYRAKLVRSNVVYTNVPYFIAYQGEEFPKDHRLPSDITVNETFRFETMGKKFLGKTITITYKSAAVDYLLKSWGYQLRESETLTLLWPPAVYRNEVAIVRTNSVHLFSSFSLEPYGNINVRSGEIRKIAKGVSRVNITSRVFVRKDNAEITMEKKTPSFKDFDVFPSTETQASVYTVPEQPTHFLFDSTGSKAISHGQLIFLTPSSSIRKYRSSYLEGVVHPEDYQVLSGQELLDDLLMHYKRQEKLSLDTFRDLELSDIAVRYIERCINEGYINSAAKYFIEEGLL